MTFAQQRRYEVLASNLIIIGTVIAVLVGYYHKKLYWDVHATRTTKNAILAAILLSIWLMYSIRRGRRWAKITYLVLIVTATVFLVVDYKRVALLMSASTATAVNAIGQDLLSAAEIVLLVMSLRKPTPEPLSVASE